MSGDVIDAQVSSEGDIQDAGGVEVGIADYVLGLVVPNVEPSPAAIGLVVGVQLEKIMTPKILCILLLNLIFH